MWSPGALLRGGGRCLCLYGRGCTALNPSALSAKDVSGAPAAPPPASVMLEACKHTAARLDVPWLFAVAEAPGSSYERKTLPLPRSAATQPHEGRSVRGSWGASLQHLHINFLELVVVFLSPKCFLPVLRGHRVLIRSRRLSVSF